jgi:ribosomal protein L4
LNLNISEPGVGVTDKAVEVSETLLGRQYNEALIHQVVVSFMAGARQGTKAQKNQIRSTRWGEKAFSSKGHWPRTRGHDTQPNLARRRYDLRSKASRSQRQGQ